MKGLIAFLGVLVLASPALAQTTAPVQDPKRVAAAARRPLPPDTRKWDIEVHRGFGFGDALAEGGGNLPSAGEPFTTGGGSNSRRVTSWYFGDGAALLNGVLASFARSERITPLDNILTNGAADVGVGHSIGARVTRTFSPRLTFEIALDVSPTTIVPSAEVNVAIGASSDGFVRAFDALVVTGQGVAFTNPAITSTFVVADGTGRDIVTTGALVLKTRPRFVSPYAVLGGGFVKGTGEAVTTLTGRYSFNLPGGARVEEHDTVRVRFAGGFGAVAMAGLGASVHFTRTYGIRLDARFLWIQNHVDTRVDTEPVVIDSLPADAIWSSLNPGIQFATHPSTNVRSNLVAPPLSGHRTMNGSGFHRRAAIGIGFFRRF